ncbi:hypothetical protein BC831DRAFT_431027 [Entophlyctis helioformis]|nr:hypothetical protein BC831DRAFT_431027 [Entophlyctis helioformis]
MLTHSHSATVARHSAACLAPGSSNHHRHNASSLATKAQDTAADHAGPPAPSTRLYVGNYGPKVTELVLIKLFQRFGRLKRIDYLWNHEGPRQGEPRGYCFLEMETVEDAGKAIAGLHGRVIEGRSLVVSYSTMRSGADDGLTPWQRREAREAAAEAMASVNKKLQANKSSAHSSTESKIRALERKLEQMKQSASTATSGGRDGGDMDDLASVVQGPGSERRGRDRDDDDHRRGRGHHQRGGRGRHGGGGGGGGGRGQDRRHNPYSRDTRK